MRQIQLIAGLVVLSMAMASRAWAESEADLLCPEIPARSQTSISQKPSSDQLDTALLVESLPATAGTRRTAAWPFAGQGRYLTEIE
jgi:hypothetical protein